MLPHFLLLCHVTFSARFQPLRTPDDVNLYKSTISALQYVCITRLHIHFTVHKLNQLMQHPYLRHRKVVLWIMRYLKGTIDYGLWFRLNHVPSSTVTLVSFVDVDWGSDLVDRKYVSGHYLLLNSNPIVWSSKK